MRKTAYGLLILVFVILSALITGCTGHQYDTLEDFLAGEEMQSLIEEDKSALADSGLSLEVTSRENQLIYTYTYSQMLEVETAKDILKEGMEAEWDAFQKFADDVKKSVKVENPVVVVRYLNPDGTEIYSETFSAEKKIRGEIKPVWTPAGFIFADWEKRRYGLKGRNFWK